MIIVFVFIWQQFRSRIWVN